MLRHCCVTLLELWEYIGLCICRVSELLLSSYLFASTPKALDYGSSELYWERRLGCVGTGNGVAGTIWTTHGVCCVICIRGVMNWVYRKFRGSVAGRCWVRGGRLPWVLLSRDDGGSDRNAVGSGGVIFCLVMLIVCIATSRHEFLGDNIGICLLDSREE